MTTILPNETGPVEEPPAQLERTPPHGSGKTPSAEESRAALERVAGSDVLDSAPRLTDFLRFVVEAALSGRAGSIKAYTVAVGALGRPHDFDPVADPIVRVEAGRLRRALERYYAEAGATDPVVISMPRGNYIPLFRFRGGDEAAEKSARNCRKAVDVTIYMRHAAALVELRRNRHRLRQNMASIRSHLESMRAKLAEINAIKISIRSR